MNLLEYIRGTLYTKKVTYPTGPQIVVLLLRFRLEETGTDGGIGTAAGIFACAEGAATGIDGMLNGDELLIGV